MTAGSSAHVGGAGEVGVGASSATVRLRLVVAYDGAPFHGFAINEGVETVAGVLADAIGRVVGAPVLLTCAGRTDKGVHAHGQVIHVDVPEGWFAQAGGDRGPGRRRRGEPSASPLASLRRSLNRMCAPSIGVRAIDVVDGEFDARFSATARRYRYLVRSGPWPDPALARRTWYVDEPLSLPAMVLGCDPLIGEHDFSAFCRRPVRSDGQEASLVRRVTEATWHDDGEGMLRFEIEASSFCHQMVRSVVGTLVDAGRGRLRPGDLLDVIRSRDRACAGQLAPPHGLTLVTVRYPGWSTDDVSTGWPAPR